MTKADNADLAALIRTIPDHPSPGVRFRDVTTLLLDANGFAATVERMAQRVDAGAVDLVAGIEARGFVFAAALAARLGRGMLLLRKTGKLPGARIGVDYALEYGSDRIEMQADAIEPGQRVVVVDDLLATGGTMAAGITLLRKVGAMVPAAAALIELTFLNGRKRLDVPCEALVSYSE
jgi:adenine phosphoribosyltransferase